MTSLAPQCEIQPGSVFDLKLPIAEVAEGCTGDGRTPRHQDAAARPTTTK
jgi:hypothetical protein